MKVLCKGLADRQTTVGTCVLSFDDEGICEVPAHMTPAETAAMMRITGLKVMEEPKEEKKAPPKKAKEVAPKAEPKKMEKEAAPAPTMKMEEPKEEEKAAKPAKAQKKAPTKKSSKAKKEDK